jgi:hypothetical protein
MKRLALLLGVLGMVGCLPAPKPMDKKAPEASVQKSSIHILDNVSMGQFVEPDLLVVCDPSRGNLVYVVRWGNAPAAAVVHDAATCHN